jgi:histidyl-tRNA synthetase
VQVTESSRQFENWRIRQLDQNLCQHMRQYGYKSVDLPIIESADLFLIKAGDQIVNRLFTFERHGQQLALRPEFTASAAYHYISVYADKQPVTRWQFSGYIFEDNPNDFAQNHQQYSIGAELIGADDSSADAEIIAMAALGLAQQNIADYQLTLGHVGLIRRSLNRFQLDDRTERFLLNHLHALKSPDQGKAFVLDQLDKLLLGASFGNSFDAQDRSFVAENNAEQMLDTILDTTQRGTTMGGRTRQDIARRLMQKRKRSVERDHIITAIDFLAEWSHIIAHPGQAFPEISNLITQADTVSQNILSQWMKLIELLDVYGIPSDRITLQPALARFWDYYTGIVFELKTTAGINLGGGGRYDELSELLGGQNKVPAVGFAYYVDNLMTAMPQASEINRQIMLLAADDLTVAGVRWASLLRQQGFDVTMTCDANFDFPDPLVLRVNADETLRLREQTYSFEQINVLIDAIKVNS